MEQEEEDGCGGWLLWFTMDWNGLRMAWEFDAWRVQGALLLFMLVYYDGDFESCRAQSIESKTGSLFEMS